MNARSIFAFTCFFLITLASYSQNINLSKGEQRRLAEKAEFHVQMGEYREAFSLYQKLVGADSSKAAYHFGLGLSVYEGSFNKIAAMPSFEKAYSLGINQDKPEIFYYLGRVYQLNQNFVAALAAYNTFLPYIQDNKAGKELKKEVETYIEQCEKGKSQVDGGKENALKWVDKRTKDVIKYYVDEQNYVKLTNLGSEVNTKYSEYGAVFFNNDELMLFTSRREGTTGNELFYDGQYFEDIYVSENIRGNWTKVVNINASDFLNKAMQNSKQHDATVSSSRDENLLFIYHDNQIQQLKKENGVWKEPQDFSSQFEAAGEFVTSASLSPDNKTVFVVSNRDDSKGGQDIYYSEWQDNGKWGELINLGDAVNTKKNEEAPFMLNDTTLYFSSQGHSSIGGYDIFVTYKRNGAWSEPKNLEIPINSPSDEINYNVSADGSYAYYASNREGGYGEYDIYRVTKGKDEEIDRKMLAQLERDNSEQQSILQGSEIEILLVDEGDEETLLLAKEVSDETKKTAKTVEDNKRALFNQKDSVAQEALALVEEAEEEAEGMDAEEVEVEEFVSQNSLADAANRFDSNGKAEQEEAATANTTFKEEVIETADKLASNTSADESDNEQMAENSNQKEQQITTQGRPVKDEYASRAVVFDDIKFEYGSSELSASSKEKLKKIAERLERDSELFAEVVGHSDNQGSEEANRKMSRLRALKAYNYLLELGVTPKRLLYAYAGQSEPLFPNDSPENRNKNRRIEAAVFKPQYQESIPFGFDKTTLGPNGETALDNIVRTLQAQAYKFIYIVGHTDDAGPAEYNQFLSEQRAQYVEGEIKKRMPNLKIRTVGFGEDKPRVSGSSYEIRQKNRRVEVIAVQ